MTDKLIAYRYRNKADNGWLINDVDKKGVMKETCKRVGTKHAFCYRKYQSQSHHMYLTSKGAA